MTDPQHPEPLPDAQPDDVFWTNGSGQRQARPSVWISVRPMPDGSGGGGGGASAGSPRGCDPTPSGRDALRDAMRRHAATVQAEPSAEPEPTPHRSSPCFPAAARWPWPVRAAAWLCGVALPERMV